MCMYGIICIVTVYCAVNLSDQPCYVFQHYYLEHFVSLSDQTFFWSGNRKGHSVIVLEFIPQSNMQEIRMEGIQLYSRFKIHIYYF